MNFSKKNHAFQKKIKTMNTILLILSLFFITSCNDDENNTFQSVEITPILISKGGIFNGNYNSTQHNEIFNNYTEWNNFVTNIWGLANIPNEATVNFNEYQVIVALDEPRPNGGHSIDITSIIENATNIVITVEKLNNGDDTQIPTRPYHFVKIPTSNKPIVFE